ncbi:MAG TPA: hypothetical protein VME67_27355 [Mycobacterium sp.]|nr:hypothetical protein [Mycobacterium sp.]HTX98224.1 hypothetical protein [Mycobacterium sp.]
MEHVRLLHRDEFLRSQEREHRAVLKAIDTLLAWVTNSVLASRWLFILALTVPLLSLLPGLEWFQRIVIIVSSNWIQLWALPALQRSQNTIQANQDAKAEVDHRNLTRIAEMLERLVDK